MSILRTFFGNRERLLVYNQFHRYLKEINIFTLSLMCKTCFISVQKIPDFRFYYIYLSHMIKPLKLYSRYIKMILWLPYYALTQSFLINSYVISTYLVITWYKPYLSWGILKKTFCPFSVIVFIYKRIALSMCLW